MAFVAAAVTFPGSPVRLVSSALNQGPTGTLGDLESPQTCGNALRILGRNFPDSSSPPGVFGS